jgi:hypothetical protein
LKSGKAQPEVTTWPAFGLWRGLLEQGRPAVAAALDALAGSRLGTDWGARMLSNESALYDHESYNNGAVWPFLSGFAALALYENERPQAAWFFIEGAKSLAFLEARGYVPELLSGDRLKPSMPPYPPALLDLGLVSPLLRGLVGIGPGRLSPQSPGWIDFEWRICARAASTISIGPAGVPGKGDRDLHLLPGGALFRSSSSKPLRPGETARRRSAVLVEAGTTAQTLTLRYRGGIEVVPLTSPSAPAIGLPPRILDERLEGGTYVARLEGRRGRTYRLRVSTGRREFSRSRSRGSGEWGPHELRLAVE